MEVLIAIALLSIFAPWLMTLPARHYQLQIQRFESQEKQRIADWSYSEIKELLLQHSIPWERLPEFKKPAVTFYLPDAQLYLPGLSSKTLKRSFTLRCKREKEGKQSEIYRLYELILSFGGPEKHKYFILIQLV